MYWIQSGIENPLKSEVIGRCGGDEKNTQNRQKSNVKRNYNPNSNSTVRLVLSMPKFLFCCYLYMTNDLLSCCYLCTLIIRVLVQVGSLSLTRVKIPIELYTPEAVQTQGNHPELGGILDI